MDINTEALLLADALWKLGEHDITMDFLWVWNTFNYGPLGGSKNWEARENDMVDCPLASKSNKVCRGHAYHVSPY